MNTEHLRMFTMEMRIAKYSPVTIKDRLDVIGRLAEHLGKPLLDATGDDLRAYQGRFAHLSPSTVNIYSRHIKAFFDWAAKRGLITSNPADDLIIASVPRGRPHPTTVDELSIIFACTRGPLRMAYTLAAFAGLRRGEICQLHRRDVDLNGVAASALVHGKGGKERIVPLLQPVVAEMHESGLGRGWIVHREGRPYVPHDLSIESTRHLHGLGLQTTLHSMRHTFATDAARMTKDPLFVRDLLGHSSVATTEIYMDSDMSEAHERLARLSARAERFLDGRPWLRAESG